MIGRIAASWSSGAGPDRPRRPVRAVLGGVLVAVACLAVATPGAAAAVEVSLNARRAKPQATVTPGFLSIAVDIASVTAKPPYDFSRSALVSLTKALVGGRPEFLRISGTQADQTYYDMTGATGGSPPSGYKFVLTRAEWDAVNRFAQTTGLRVFFGFNAGPGPRTATYQWLPDNAEQLLGYTRDRRYPLGAVEFGNEPNVFYGTDGVPPSYTAASYAHDLQTFDALRAQLAPGAPLVGPGPLLTPGDPSGERPISVSDVATKYGLTMPTPSAARVGVPLGPEARDTMPLLPKDFFGAVNYHFYPAFATTCPYTPHLPSDPLSPSWLDELLANQGYMASLRDRYDPDRPIWVGETGSAACGGQSGYSDRFIETFFWLNELGQLARQGVAVVVRQTLSGGIYGLLSEPALTPNPDFWASLLWRRLMGARQLAPAGSKGPATVRVFAACTPGRPRGRVTFLVLNLSRAERLRVRLRGAGRHQASLYLLRSPNLYSSTVLLNGRALSAPGGTVPKLSPRPVRGRVVELPPTSYAFIVEAASSPACASARSLSRGGRAKERPW